MAANNPWEPSQLPLQSAPEDTDFRIRLPQPFFNKLLNIAQKSAWCPKLYRTIDLTKLVPYRPLRRCEVDLLDTPDIVFNEENAIRKMTGDILAITGVIELPWFGSPALQIYKIILEARYNG